MVLDGADGDAERGGGWHHHFVEDNRIEEIAERRTKKIVEGVLWREGMELESKQQKRMSKTDAKNTRESKCKVARVKQLACNKWECFF